MSAFPVPLSPLMTTGIETFASFSILWRSRLIGADRPINAEAPRRSRRALILLPQRLEKPPSVRLRGSTIGQWFTLALRGEDLSQMKRRFKLYETAFHFLAIGRFGMQAVRFASRRGRL